MGNHILAGMPFCRQNGVEMSISKEQFYVKGHTIPFGTHPQQVSNRVRAVNCCSNTLLDEKLTVSYPSDSVHVLTTHSCPYKSKDILESQVVLPVPRNAHFLDSATYFM